MKNEIKKFSFHIPFLLITASLLMFLLVTDNPFGLLADHTFFAVHLISNKVYFLKNGWFSPPFYSPSFSGGFPGYADPQDMYFSFLQVFVNLIPNYYVALKIAFVVQLWLAYLGMFRLMLWFNCDRNISVWASIIFAFSGYNISRWIIGHLTFISYWTLPWIVYELVQMARAKSWPEVAPRVVRTALFLGIVVYGSDVYTLYISTVLCIAMLVTDSVVRRVRWSRYLCGGLLLTMLTAFALVGSRLMAIFDLLRQFPRPSTPDIFSFGDALKIVFGGLFDFSITSTKRFAWLPDFLWYEGSAYVGVVVGVFVIAATIFLFRSGWRNKRRWPEIYFFGLWAILTSLAAIILMTGPFGFWELARKIPGVASNHGTYRIVGALPLPLIGLCALLMQHFSESGKRKLMLIGVMGLALADLGFYYGRLRFESSSQIRLSFPEPLENVVIRQWTPIDNLGGVFAPNPMFGWHQSDRKPQIDLSKPPWAVFPDGTYNVTDPSAMLYAGELNRPPWSRLPTSVGEEKLIRFLSFKDPGFYIAKRQKAANFISMSVLFACLAFLVLIRKSEGNDRYNHT